MYPASSAANTVCTFVDLLNTWHREGSIFPLSLVLATLEITVSLKRSSLLYRQYWDGIREISVHFCPGIHGIRPVTVLRHENLYSKSQTRKSCANAKFDCKKW
jgi:hypothetical protein